MPNCAVFRDDRHGSCDLVGEYSCFQHELQQEVLEEDRERCDVEIVQRLRDIVMPAQDLAFEAAGVVANDVDGWGREAGAVALAVGDRRETTKQVNTVVPALVLRPRGLAGRGSGEGGHLLGFARLHNGCAPMGSAREWLGGGRSGSCSARGGAGGAQLGVVGGCKGIAQVARAG